MKAMILAAGEGRRLRPLTNTTPKPMLPLADRPLLEHIIIHLRNCGVTDFAVNLYHLPNVVIDYFGDGNNWNVTIRYSVEEELLGSAGGLKQLESFFDSTFIVYYGDVFTHANLHPMIDFHRKSGAIATMALYPVPDPWNRGIVQLSENSIITNFAEKPPRDKVFSNLANAGIYILEPDVFNWIPSDTVYDFGHDVFPNMLAQDVQMAGYVIEAPLIDIGLPKKYYEADQLASTLKISN